MQTSEEILVDTQKNHQNFDIQPFGWKYIEGLRSSNYRYTTALAELTDNSEDAGANNITIKVERANGKISRIFHFDDGQGMNHDVLIGSFTLGFERNDRQSSQLGKFGIGGTQSCLKLAKKKTVLTKTKKGKLLARKYDLDIVKEKDIWGTISYEPSAEEAKLFKDFAKSSKQGTLVILENLDGIKTDRLDNVVRNLSRHYSKVYCEKVGSDGKNIIINDTKVDPLDPLCFYNGAKVLYDEPLEGTDIGKEDGTVSSKIRLRIVDIKGLPVEKTDSLRLNQGGYIFRNNRLISSGIFNKTNGTVKMGPAANDHLNHMRWGLYYDGDHDSVMGTNVAKTSIDPIQSIQTKVTNIVNPFARQIESRSKRASKKPTQSEQELDKKDIADLVEAAVPNIVINQESEDTASEETNVVDLNLTKSTQEVKFHPLEEIYDEASSRFMKVTSNEEGIKLKINLDHRFVYRYWTNGSKETRELMKVLVSSLASSLLINKNGDYSDEIISDFEHTLSNYLRKTVSISDRK